MISKVKLQQAVNILVEVYHPEAMYLFGSYAWGTPNEDSDVDLMIILKEDYKSEWDFRKKGNRALAGIGFSVDFIFNTVDSFKERSQHVSTLEYKILKESSIVYAETRGVAVQG